MRAYSLAASGLIASLFAACGWGLSSRPGGPPDRTSDGPFTEAPIALSQGAPSKAPPRDLPGVNTGGLEGREKQDWWELVTSLYAPCSDAAVPVAQCIEEKRACAPCTPMAQLLADQIRAGTAKANAKAAVAARFSPDLVKDVQVGDAPSRGPANAPVTIVVFSDFQCPACKSALPMLETVAAAHSREVRLAHKFYPLPKHTRSKDAAYAAIGAHKQGKYWQMEKIIFEHQETLSDQDLAGFATTLGLDLPRWHADRTAPETKAWVERDVRDGETAGLTHTPFVLINGRLFDPAYFRYDRDLDPWVVTEVQLVRAGHGAKGTPPAIVEPAPPASASSLPAPSAAPAR